MIDHTGFVVKDLATARTFYDAIAKPLGLQTKTAAPEFFLLGKSQEEPIPYVWIGTLRPSYWPPGAEVGMNTMHFAFVAEDREAVDAFYKAALAAGGKDNGPPGPREGAPNYYGAFVLDPDGNNIEAAYRWK